MRDSLRPFWAWLFLENCPAIPYACCLYGEFTWDFRLSCAALAVGAASPDKRPGRVSSAANREKAARRFVVKKGKQQNLQRPCTLWLLLFLLVFLGLGGLYGGISMLTDTTGGSLQLTEVLPLLPPGIVGGFHSCEALSPNVGAVREPPLPEPYIPEPLLNF
ncbi:MAG TPA: hypothetical protein VMW72_09095 [Sedimentisphaerales bacterium]|nr:hypothetical protein [Sedimentisphaerales bacterium]